MNHCEVLFVWSVAASLLQLSSGSLPRQNPSESSLQSDVLCDLNQLETQGYDVNYCVEDDIYGQFCKVRDVDSSVTIEKQCLNGVWVNSRKSVGLYNDQNPHEHNEYVNRPPRFEANCPPHDLQDEYIVTAGSESVHIRWTDPSATDDDGQVQSVRQIFGTRNGGSFEGSSTGRKHSIVYEAIDNSDFKATCYFSFIVKVVTCSALSWPSNGHIYCPNGRNLGQSCHYGCDSGYQLSSNISTVTCNNTHRGPEWTSIPTCEESRCGKPPEVENGTVMCTGQSYNSHCTVSCSKGFKLNGQVLIQCKADGIWLWLSPTTCTDDLQPELFCTTPQVFYAERGSLSVTVNWKEPTATDNIDPSPTVIKTSGPDQGISVEAGTSKFVRYKATDSAGNQSPVCTIELRAIEVSCGHPLDTLLDHSLLFNCTMSSYTIGDVCALTCDLNLPLEGSTTITCKLNQTTSEKPNGYWEWDGAVKPHCKDIACPKLNPPRNGALVFDKLSKRPVTTMLCNDNFDIPTEITRFNGIFICLDSGKWYPNLSKAPDCIEPRSSRGFRLPSKLFYYSGTCGEDDNILSQFDKIVSDLNAIFPIACPPDVTCKAVNPKVTCGKTNKTKRSIDSDPFLQGRPLQSQSHIHSFEKREADGYVLTLSFDIQTDFNYTGMSTKDIEDFVDKIQTLHLKKAVQNEINNGSLHLANWTLRTDSFQTASNGSWYCEPGFIRSGNTNVCKPCAPGRYELDGVCTECPVGEYTNTTGSLACTKCPDGYSTRHEATESVDNCTKECNPGSYSPSTYAPCAQCKVGFYQPQSGQRTCIACPTGKTTETTGRTAKEDCQYFDVLLDETGGMVPVGEVAALNEFSVMFWIKIVSIETSSTVISVGDFLDVEIADVIKVNVKTEPPVSYYLESLSSDVWVHVAVVWNATSRYLSAYYKGTKVINQHLASSTRDNWAHNGTLSISNTASTGVLVSGLSLRNVVIRDTGVNHASTTCHTTDTNELINMDHFKHISQNGISLNTPSICNAKDACANAPCGPNKCTSRIGGFTCICSNGWTGRTCSTPPDFCKHNDCVNDASCVSGLTNYTCQCKQGYTGVLCEIPPVDGDWSAWSAWSDCTKTCNNGTQQRTRECNSPPPDRYGKDCVGEARETMTCGTSRCPECFKLQRGFGNLLSCTTTKMSRSCTVTCKDGHILPNGLQTEIHTCGVDTNYVWLPTGRFPDCVRPNHVERYVIDAIVDYTTAIQLDDKQGVTDSLYTNALATDCYKSQTCETSVIISDGSRKKRSPDSSGSTVTLRFTVPLTDKSDLQLGECETNGTAVSSALQETIDAINNLQATVKAINSSASLLFDVTVNGNTYTWNPNTLAFNELATCPSGQIETNAMCVECPQGTYKNGHYCSFCKRGTFQSRTGQSECTPCPSGYTTAIIGSTSSFDCLVRITTYRHSYNYITSTNATADAMSPLTTLADKDRTAIYVSVPTSVVVVLVILIVVLTKVYRRRQQMKELGLEDSDFEQITASRQRQQMNELGLEDSDNEQTTASRQRQQMNELGLEDSDFEQTTASRQRQQMNELGLEDSDFEQITASRQRQQLEEFGLENSGYEQIPVSRQSSVESTAFSASPHMYSKYRQQIKRPRAYGETET